MNIKIRVIVSAALLLVVAVFNKVSAQAKTKTSRQIELLQKEKNARSAVQKKIDSQLLQAIKENQGKKMTEGVDLEPANVNADNKGNLQVDISAEVTDLLLSKIKSLGGTIVYPSKEYKTIRAAINLSMVEKIAGFSEVKFIAPAAMSHLNNTVRPGKKLPVPGTDEAIPSPASKPKYLVIPQN